MNKLFLLFFIVPALGMSKTNLLGITLDYSLVHSSAKKIWNKDNTSPETYAGNGKTRFVHHQISFSHRLNDLWRYTLGTTYSQTSMTRGSAGGSFEGDERNGFSSLSAGAARTLLKTNYVYSELGLIVEHPIKHGQSSDYDKSPDIFIAPNDGAMKTRINSWNQFTFMDLFSLNFQASYTFRDDGLSDFVDLDLQVPFRIGEKFGIGPGLNLKQTLGGVDLGTPEYLAQVELRNGGNSKIEAFSRVKEEVLGVSLFATYKHDDLNTFRVYWNKKLEGRNTDIATTIGIGYSKKY